MVRLRAMILPVVLVAALAGGCVKKSGEPAYRPFDMVRLGLGTRVELKIYQLPPERARAAAEAAFAIMDSLYRLLDKRFPDNTVGLLNKNAGIRPVRVDDAVMVLLKKGKEYKYLTKGLFDVTIDPLVKVWDIEHYQDMPPSAAELKKMRAVARIKKGLVYSAGLVLTDSTAFLKSEGMGVDLGGIAKGYIVDRMAQRLELLGVPGALVNAGGDIRVVGSKDGIHPWDIGIRHPRSRADLIARIRLAYGAITSSGDYERFFTLDGRRYHHILDVRSGMPATGCVAVTIVARTAMDADALSTGVFVLGPEQGMQLIEETADVEGVIFYKEEGMLVHSHSSGLEGRVTY